MGDPSGRREGRVAEARTPRDPAGPRRPATSLQRVGDARDAAAQRVADIGERVGVHRAPEARLRGVSHQWAFFVSLVAGSALIVAAPTASDARGRRVRDLPVSPARSEALYITA